MPAKKLVVSTYLQYVLIGTGALLLFTFVRQLGGVLLSFLLAGILAYVLNPLVRWLEGHGIPRVLAVLGVFAALVAVVLFTLFVLIVPAAGQVQALIRAPQVLVDGAAALVDRMREFPYVGERVAIGAVFAVPIVAIIAAVFRYLLRGTVVFERWHKAPVVAVGTAGDAPGQMILDDASPGKARASAIPAGNPGDPPRGERSTGEGE